MRDPRRALPVLRVESGASGTRGRPVLAARAQRNVSDGARARTRARTQSEGGVGGASSFTALEVKSWDVATAATPVNQNCGRGFGRKYSQ